MTSQHAKLILGPIPYLWGGEAWRDFYFRIADEAPLDVVVLGEVVCSKRMHFHAPFEEEVIARLSGAGKEVRLAGLALSTLQRERRQQAALLKRHTFAVEVGDLSALLTLSGRPHTIGPLMNTYSAATAAVYAARGAQSICLPPEIALEAICDIARQTVETEIEVFAFGRTPLAISARCAHARAKGHTKDNCQFVCGDEPDGLTVKTLDGQSFLTLNGVQTMSHTCHLVLGEIDELTRAGVTAFRLSPQNCDMVAVSKVFRNVLDGTCSAPEARQTVAEIYCDVPFSNGFLYGVEGARWVDAA